MQMNLNKWSRNWFNNHYHEDIYDYLARRFTPTLNKYLNGIKGPILDAACGFRNVYLRKLHLSNVSSVGIDIDPAVKDRNKLHKKFFIQDMHQPINNNHQFNGIISVYTWEHLHSPELVLKNFFDVLSNNGVVIIIAPQRWHYISAASRLIPYHLHKTAWRLLKGKKHSPFPVYYKLCSKKALSLEAQVQGFSVEYFSSVEGPPLWFQRIPPLFIIACFWMSFVNKYRIFDNIRSTFIAVLKKT